MNSTPRISVAPSLQFSAWPNTSQNNSLYAYNNSLATFPLTVTLSGDPEFTLWVHPEDAAEDCRTKVLEPLKGCKTDVLFRPSAVGSYSATVTVTGPGGSPSKSVSLSGEATAPPVDP